MTYATRGSIPHSQELSNIPYSKLNETNISSTPVPFKIYYNIILLCNLGVNKIFLRVRLPVKILKENLASYILVTCLVQI